MPISKDEKERIDGIRVTHSLRAYAGRSYRDRRGQIRKVYMEVGVIMEGNYGPWIKISAIPVSPIWDGELKMYPVKRKYPKKIHLEPHELPDITTRDISEWENEQSAGD